jgi:hypothetical protein
MAPPSGNGAQAKVMINKIMAARRKPARTMSSAGTAGTALIVAASALQKYSG